MQSDALSFFLILTFLLEDVRPYEKICDSALDLIGFTPQLGSKSSTRADHSNRFAKDGAHVSLVQILRRRLSVWDTRPSSLLGLSTCSTDVLVSKDVDCDLVAKAC